MKIYKHDQTGKTFGRLTVIRLYSRLWSEAGNIVQWKPRENCLPNSEIDISCVSKQRKTPIDNHKEALEREIEIMIRKRNE